MARAAVQSALLGAWRQRGALATLLWPMSLVYRLLWQVRAKLYRSGLLQVQRAGVPLIVVGNIVAGGGGKTPLVMALVAHLQTLGLRPGVVSRGYGRDTRACRAVQADSPVQDVGDEPLLIRRRTGVPVFVAKARVEAARALLSTHPDVDLLIADDGLQHLGLYRDIEICVVDERGVGNGWLLPAGPLREPWPRATDLVLYAGDQAPQIGAFRLRRSLSPRAVHRDGSSVPLAMLAAPAKQDKPLRAVAGIARPEAFFAMLRDCGLQLKTTHALPDHARFDALDWSGFGDDIVLCTEKDAVKVWRYRPDALAVPLQVQPEPAFWPALERLLNERGSDALRAKLSSGHGHKAS